MVLREMSEPGFGGIKRFLGNKKIV